MCTRCILDDVIGYTVRRVWLRNEAVNSNGIATRSRFAWDLLGAWNFDRERTFFRMHGCNTIGGDIVFLKLRIIQKRYEGGRKHHSSKHQTVGSEQHQHTLADATAQLMCLTTARKV
jgi:hypothetical protein